MSRKYDAAVAQRVSIEVAHEGQLYPVVLRFHALNDDLIFNYVNAEDAEEKSPAQVFFAKEIESAEGIEYETLEELCELMPRAEQEFAVRQALLGVQRKELQLAHGKKLNWKNTSPTQTYYLNCFFDDAEVETAITLSNPTPEQLRVARALENRAFPVRFGETLITSLPQGLRALYQACKSEISGYVGEAPLHHQMLAVTLHLSGYRRLLLGK